MIGKFGVLCFLVTSALRLAILAYYRRIEGIPGVMSCVICRAALSCQQSSCSCSFRLLKSYDVPITSRQYTFNLLLTQLRASYQLNS